MKISTTTENLWMYVLIMKNPLIPAGFLPFTYFDYIQSRFLIKSCSYCNIIRLHNENVIKLPILTYKSGIKILFIPSVLFTSSCLNFCHVCVKVKNANWLNFLKFIKILLSHRSFSVIQSTCQRVNIKCNNFLK